MNELWKSVLTEIEFNYNVSETNFKTWFRATELESIDDQIAIVLVRNSFHINQMRKKFYDIIKDALNKKGYSPEKIDFRAKKSGTKKNNREISPQEINDQRRKTSSQLNEILSHKNYSTNENLNPKYTFDNFIVGSSNDLAYAAAKTVSEIPGEKYNPLFFYGGAGLGKTHLMQAIGNKIKQLHPDLRILYITIENFYKDYLENVRSKKQGYANKYRDVDVLIIDDIQFIAGKEKTQEEFFHTFNELHQANKQIIISSDRAPKSIPTLTDRLRSRFEWGMAIDIQMPDIETREAIIESKAEISGVKLDSETISFLASNIRTNIRELEGLLNSLIANAELRGIQPDIELAKGIISDSVKSARPQHLTYKKIIEKSSKFFQIPKEEILGRRRSKDINHARQVACYLMKYELKMSFPEIGKIFSRDHSTIMNSVSKIEKGLKLDMEVREQIASLTELIYE